MFGHVCQGTEWNRQSRLQLILTPLLFFLLWLATTQPSQNCHGLPTGPCLPLPASVCVPHSSRVQLDSWLWHSSASPSRRAACIDPLHSRPHPPVCFCGRMITLPSLCLERQPSPDSQPAVFLQALPCFYSKATSGKCLPGTYLRLTPRLPFAPPADTCTNFFCTQMLILSPQLEQNST